MSRLLLPALLSAIALIAVAAMEATESHSDCDPSATLEWLRCE